MDLKAHLLLALHKHMQLAMCIVLFRLLGPTYFMLSKALSALKISNLDNNAIFAGFFAFGINPVKHVCFMH